MKIDFTIADAATTAPDYRTLRALIAVHAGPTVAVSPSPIAVSGADACRFSRAGVARVFGLGEQGKDVLNLHGSRFGELGGVRTSQKPSDPAIGKNVQGAYA